MDPKQPKRRLPHNKNVHDDHETTSSIIAKGEVGMLEEMRTGSKMTPNRRKKVKVAPGCSISAEDLMVEGTVCTDVFHSFLQICVPYLANFTYLFPFI